MKPAFPRYCLLWLTLVVLGCVCVSLLTKEVPFRADASAISRAPSQSHWFGTDTLGRDLFAAIWYGGRISLFVGLLSTAVSTLLALLYGCAAGLATPWLDDGMMRFAEIFMSVPQILLILFLQAMLGEANVFSMALVIGLTGWMAVAKMVRSEVRQIGNAEFILAARAMGGGFFYILRQHLLPNVVPAILFMVVTNLGTAIGLESTLSFLGVGLSADTLSWGSLMSLSQRAILTGAWWTLLLPGTFLVTTLICVTEMGEYLRNRNSREILL